MKKQDVEKLFSYEPFKSAKKHNSREESSSYTFPEGVWLTAETVNNNELLYFFVRHRWKEKCQARQIQDREICKWNVYLTITIKFNFDKVSSFEIEAERSG